MKNAIYAVIIVVCLVLAVVIFRATRGGGSSGIDSIKRGKITWLMCNNPECKHAWQIDEKDYYLQIEEKVKQNPMSMQTPALTCEKCGEPSAFRAVKCEKCGHMFFYGNPNDFNDRCPECGYSKMEADREARKAGGPG